MQSLRQSTIGTSSFSPPLHLYLLRHLSTSDSSRLPLAARVRIVQLVTRAMVSDSSPDSDDTAGGAEAEAEAGTGASAETRAGGGTGAEKDDGLVAQLQAGRWRAEVEGLLLQEWRVALECGGGAKGVGGTTSESRELFGAVLSALRVMLRLLPSVSACFDSTEALVRFCARELSGPDSTFARARLLAVAVNGANDAAKALLTDLGLTLGADDMAHHRADERAQIIGMPKVPYK